MIKYILYIIILINILSCTIPRPQIDNSLNTKLQQYKQETYIGKLSKEIHGIDIDTYIFFDNILFEITNNNIIMQDYNNNIIGIYIKNENNLKNIYRFIEQSQK